MISPITHPDFQEWEMEEFCVFSLSPRPNAEIRCNGVVVGYRHDCDGRYDTKERATSVSDDPRAVAKVQNFYAAAMNRKAELDAISSAKFRADCERRARETEMNARAALGLD